MIDYANDFAQGDTLVHVESSPRVAARALWRHRPRSSHADAGGEPGSVRSPRARPRASGADSASVPAARPSGAVARRSFDRRTGSSLDFREPLATTFAARFYQNAAFTGGTDYLVWRDSLFNVYFGDEDGFSCSAGPGWFPLNERQVVFFDEQENPETACTISPCPEEDILFPLETQRVSIGDLDVTPESGWTYMNLNQVWCVIDGGRRAVRGAGVGDGGARAEGRFSAGLPAVQLDSMCDFSSVILGPTGPDFPARGRDLLAVLLGLLHHRGPAVPTRLPPRTARTRQRNVARSRKSRIRSRLAARGADPQGSAPLRCFRRPPRPPRPGCEPASGYTPAERIHSGG